MHDVKSATVGTGWQTIVDKYVFSIIWNVLKRQFRYLLNKENILVEWCFNVMISRTYL